MTNELSASLTQTLGDLFMKYLAIVVLLAIIIGAVFHYVNHGGKPPEAKQDSGWMQR